MVVFYQMLEEEGARVLSYPIDARSMGIFRPSLVTTDYVLMAF